MVLLSIRCTIGDMGCEICDKCDSMKRELRR
jgi:hypothetical protein